MRAVALTWIIGSSVSVIASIQAHAQPLIPNTESIIRSTVANLDLNFIAKVVGFRHAKQDEEPIGSRELNPRIRRTLRISTRDKSSLVEMRSEPIARPVECDPMSLSLDFKKPEIPGVFQNRRVRAGLAPGRPRRV